MYQEYSQTAPIIFGSGAVSILGEKVKEFGCKKVLLAFEAGIEAAGIVKKATDSLEASGVDYVTFNGIMSDPTDDVVDKGAAVALSAGVDCIVGLGGGSCMDTAKAMSILLTNPGPAKNYILAKPISVDTKVPVILVPTTSGTGSEVTRVAIISRPDVNAKWSVFVNVSLAIVDPELTMSLPRTETANTGLDALAHAAEAMTSVNWNPHSDIMGEAAIKKISKNLVTCYNEPGNIEARSEMSLAANLAGLAFNNPITHVGHAIADALSGAFHTPHGFNCALALSESLAVVAPVMPDRMKTIAEALDIDLTGKESGEELGKLVSDRITGMMRAMNVKSLKEMGFTRESVVGLASEVASNHLASYCPIEITEKNAAELLAKVYDNYL